MTNGEKRLLLGSASERRRAILAELVDRFDTAVPDVLEAFHENDPHASASQSAVRKNLWCRKNYPAHHAITADTVISFQGRCLGKPDSIEQAAEFFRTFSGQRQDILTGVAFSTPAEPVPDCMVVKSTVTFRKLTDSIISEYFSKVNPLDKAGAYDINQSSDIIIERFEGSYSNIMGLPKDEVAEWLRRERFI